MSEFEPRVTVVVMTRNRRDELLRSLERHPRPVIVIDNGSTDGSAEAAAGLDGVRVIALGRNIGAQARNVGVERAATKYVAFADDDSWWEPGALETAAKVFDEHPRLGLLAARMLVGDEAREDPVSAVMERSPLPRGPDQPGPPVLGFVACAAVVRREAFLQAGGFDDVVFFAGEEARVSVDLATRGWDQCYLAEVVARHEPSPSRSSDCHRQRLVSRNAVLTAVMRRPWRAVLRITARQVLRERCSAAGAAWALVRLPAALRRRRTAPAEVERNLRLLDEF